jgi:CDP-diacylglycerol--glycerol-3-phosphate 3-phosphatidyltransferase
MSDKARYMLVQYVTVARVPLAIAASALLWFACPGDALAAAVVGLLVVCELTDIFDGFLARSLGAESRFGALFDPYCDSMSRLIIFYGLSVKGVCPPWLFLVMALRDTSVAYIRIMYILNGRRASARLSGKAKAWVQGLGAILLASLFAWTDVPHPFQFGANWVTTAIVLAIAGVTAWSLLDYFGASQQKGNEDPPPSDAT